MTGLTSSSKIDRVRFNGDSEGKGNTAPRGELFRLRRIGSAGTRLVLPSMGACSSCLNKREIRRGMNS